MMMMKLQLELILYCQFYHDNNNGLEVVSRSSKIRLEPRRLREDVGWLLVFLGGRGQPAFASDELRL